MQPWPPVTLFTGQWADLPLEELAAKAGRVGLRRARARLLGRPLRRRQGARRRRLLRAARRELLERHGLGVWAIGAHLVGQAVCDLIDERHRAILPPEVWGDGDPEGVRRRAAERMKDTARAAAKLGVTQVNGFTGSSIWHLLYSFPPNDFDEIERGYEEFAERLEPDPRRVRRRGRALRARGAPDRDRLRLRDDAARRSTRSATARRSGSTSTRATSRTSSSTRRSSRSSSPTGSTTCTSRTRSKRLDGRRSILGSHLNFGDEARGWDFVSPGPRRRRLRGALPRAEPDRLPRAALDRVGGLRHGSRLGRAGRARVRAPDRLRAVGDRLRRRDAEGGDAMSEEASASTSAATGGAARSPRSASACSATRSWARRTRTRYKKLSVHGLAAAARPRLVSIAGRDEAAVAEAARRYGFERARDRLARARRRSRGAALRQRRPEQPARRADDRGGRGRQARVLREAARPRRRRELRDLAARRARPASST